MTINTTNNGPENHIANAGKMVVEDGVVAELRAIDEEAMYQQPATTHKAINRAADRIEQLLATNADLERKLERIAVLWKKAAFPANVAEAGDIYDAIDREFAALNDITGEGVR